jgi:L-ascorbate metabolism protein UlaG (beta-lactamase superfamily)
MIKPFLQEDAFLQDIENARIDRDRLHIWWLGQSGYIFQWQGHHLLIDPYLSDSLTKKYDGTEKPHIRLIERVIAPERMGFIEAVTSSHNHTDHLDGETLIPLLGENPNISIIVSQANINFAANRLQVLPGRLTGIKVDTAPIKVGPFTLHAIPSAHETLGTDENGDHKYIGLIIEVGGRTIYHSGDCMLYEGLENRLKKWKIDLALLPINGRDPTRGVPGNFNSKEAALLGREINAEMTIPCHYEMFEFNSVSPEGFINEAGRIGQKIHILKCGERFDL